MVFKRRAICGPMGKCEWGWMAGNPLYALASNPPGSPATLPRAPTTKVTRPPGPFVDNGPCLGTECAYMAGWREGTRDAVRCHRHGQSRGVFAYGRWIRMSLRANANRSAFALSLTGGPLASSQQDLLATANSIVLSLTRTSSDYLALPAVNPYCWSLGGVVRPALRQSTPPCPPYLRTRQGDIRPSI